VSEKRPEAVAASDDVRVPVLSALKELVLEIDGVSDDIADGEAIDAVIDGDALELEESELDEEKAGDTDKDEEPVDEVEIFAVAEEVALITLLIVSFADSVTTTVDDGDDLELGELVFDEENADDTDSDEEPVDEAEIFAVAEEIALTALLTVSFADSVTTTVEESDETKDLEANAEGVTAFVTVGQLVGLLAVPETVAVVEGVEEAVEFTEADFALDDEAEGVDDENEEADVVSVDEEEAQADSVDWALWDGASDVDVVTENVTVAVAEELLVTDSEPVVLDVELTDPDVVGVIDTIAVADAEAEIEFVLVTVRVTAGEAELTTDSVETWVTVGVKLDEWVGERVWATEMDARPLAV
jgi:hypothetical protein